MRGKGINYDTGFMPGCRSRSDFDPGVVAAEVRVIARELGCTAVRITGADPERIDVAARAAAAEGLEVWFSPFPVEVPMAGMTDMFRDCADRAERLRRDGAEVVLVIGCEITLFNPGYLPGTFFYDRIRRLARPGPRQLAAFARLPKRLNAFLAEAAQAARGQFGGPLTYAAGTWEPVDWSRFDIVSVDAYRDADLASYGLVSMLPEGSDRGYQGLGWRPRLAFETMAALPVS